MPQFQFEEEVSVSLRVLTVSYADAGSCCKAIWGCQGPAAVQSAGVSTAATVCATSESGAGIQSAATDTSGLARQCRITVSRMMLWLLALLAFLLRVASSIDCVASPDLGNDDLLSSAYKPWYACLSAAHLQTVTLLPT